MKTEEIELLRENYYSLVKEKQELLAIKKRILELEQTSEVKEYLDLVNRINSKHCSKEKSNRELVRDAINFSNITPTIYSQIVSNIIEDKNIINIICKEN